MEEKRTSGAACVRALTAQNTFRRGVTRGEPRRLLDEAVRGLETVYAAMGSFDARELPRSLEWLADNRYVLQRERGNIVRALEGLPKKPGSRPLMLALAEGYLAACRDAGETPGHESVLRFFREAGTALNFTEEELNALPVLLRLAAIRHIAEDRETLRVLAAAPASARRGEAREADREAARRMDRGFALLRYLGSRQLESALEGLSVPETLYAGDPAGAYASMDEETRRAYRARTVTLAKKAGLSERRTAERVLELASAGKDPRTRHVGYWLFEEPLGRRPGRAPQVWDVLTRHVLPPALALLIGLAARSAAAGLLSLLPLYALMRELPDPIALRRLPRRVLPRMTAETPPAARTLCVITALLTKPGDAAAYARRLEAYRLAAGNIGGSMDFGLLADFRESKREEEPEDAAILEAACREIAALNEKWGGSFLLLWRPRRYAAADGRYMGRERKRGALEDLVRHLKGRPSDLRVGEGRLTDYAYIITLDADTEPAIGALRALVAAMEHPLNRPVIDPARRVVTAGHALLHPRIDMALESAGRSAFAAIYAGPGGSDPYGAAPPDLEYDVWDESRFTGKGIFDVEAYAALLDGRFPENAILSHDMLEGSYLRAGYAGDLAFQDGFPGSFLAWLRREHRWIRGDWQLLPWLFPRVRTGSGREHSPLSLRARLRICDNLRRSLTPAALLAAFLIAPWCPAGRIPALLSTLALAAPLLLSAVPGTRERYFSRVLTGLRAALCRSLFDFAALPARAWVGLSAACTALWRTFVTHRGMLEWVTAAQAEEKREDLRGYYTRMWPCLPAAALLLAAPFRGVLPAALCILTAFAFLAAPFAAYRLSRRTARKTPTLAPADTDWLRGQAGRMAGYFRDHMNAENNWLPPDNVQLQPAVGEARRTSPTNIGLGMLSLLAMLDLGLDGEDAVVDRLERTTATLERMEKWRGHLYNWYGTADLRPMLPRRVSTVDSGNLIACLIALEQGLQSLTFPRATDLARRIRRLSDGMRLAPLYDRERRLFRMGWDAEHDRPAEGHYDLLASEARLTSYVAVARGEADVRHWARLGRPLLGRDGYRGLGSWSGTMFEYLMPPLLLPTVPDSLFWESERFALYCQRRRVPAELPYGISESGFFAFDTDMNYQYKAHGVQALGFKRGLDRETVLAPYAGFLALLTDPVGAAENLRRYEKLDMSGPYGLFEALDLTRPRVPEGCARMPVRSYMAHHVGMSLLAADHVLCGGAMQRRFMADARMNAFRSLLAERIPLGAELAQTREPETPLPERMPPRQEKLLWEGKGYDPWRPRCAMLSNGSYRVLVTDTGLNRTLCGMRDLTRFDEKPVGGAPGLLFFITDGETLHSLTPAPFYDPAADYSARFETGSAVVTMRREGLSAGVTTLVCPDDAAAVRRVWLKNTGDAPRRLTLVCYLEPALDEGRAFSAHPAFSKLFLRAEALPDGVLIARRGPEGEAYCLCLRCSERPAHICTSRELALGRAGCDGLRRIPAGEGGAGVPDPCAALRIPVELAPGGEQLVTFSLSWARRAEDAELAARRALGLDASAASHRMAELCAALSLSPESAAAAFDLWRDAAFPTPDRRRLAPWREQNTLGREILWKYGVSGDLPVIAVLTGDEPGEREERILRRHMFLYCCGAYADLLLFLRDGGDYLRPAHTALLDMMGAWGGENLTGTRESWRDSWPSPGPLWTCARRRSPRRRSRCLFISCPARGKRRAPGPT